MTVTLELTPEIEASLSAQAKAQGLPLLQYVQHLLEERASVRIDMLAPRERAAAWRTLSHGLPIRPPLSDTAISRESIYDTRG